MTVDQIPDFQLDTQLQTFLCGELKAPTINFDSETKDPGSSYANQIKFLKSKKRKPQGRHVYGLQAASCIFSAFAYLTFDAVAGACCRSTSEPTLIAGF